MSNITYTNKVLKGYTQLKNYHGFTGANSEDLDCDDGDPDKTCVRNYATISEKDRNKYELVTRTRWSDTYNEGLGKCGPAQADKTTHACGDDSKHQDELFYSRLVGGEEQCAKQPTCSVANMSDCLTLNGQKAKKAEKAISQLNEPDRDDRIKISKDWGMYCSYDMISDPATDFRNAETVSEYIDRYGWDDNVKYTIMPYFSSFPADYVTMDTRYTGKDKEPNSKGVYPSDAQWIKSRFLSTGLDGTICQQWANNAGKLITKSDGSQVQTDPNAATLADLAMENWCNKYPWLPECRCLKAGDPVYGDPYYPILKVGMGSTANDGCWYAPCSFTNSQGMNTLVTTTQRYPTTGQCESDCNNVLWVIGNEKIDWDEINQNMSCDIDESDIPYPTPESQCDTAVDPKACHCGNVHFTGSEDFIVESGVKQQPYTSKANTSIITEKANAYKIQVCDKSEAYAQVQIDSYLSTPPVLTKLPKFDEKTGTLTGQYINATSAQTDKARSTFQAMISPKQFPCMSTYVVPNVPGATGGIIVTNENYTACVNNEKARFSHPDSQNACPYTYSNKDVYGNSVPKQEVNKSYRAACVKERGLGDNLPQDGQKPTDWDSVSDDTAEKYHLCEPIDNKCPNPRTYVDENGEKQSVVLSSDQIEECEDQILDEDDQEEYEKERQEIIDTYKLDEPTEDGECPSTRSYKDSDTKKTMYMNMTEDEIEKCEDILEQEEEDDKKDADKTKKRKNAAIALGVILGGVLLLVGGAVLIKAVKNNQQNKQPPGGVQQSQQGFMGSYFSSQPQQSYRPASPLYAGGIDSGFASMMNGNQPWSAEEIAAAAGRQAAMASGMNNGMMMMM